MVLKLPFLLYLAVYEAFNCNGVIFSSRTNRGMRKGQNFSCGGGQVVSVAVFDFDDSEFESFWSLLFYSAKLFEKERKRTMRWPIKNYIK